MKISSFLSCTLALLAAAGPAPNGCGDQCYTATDDCGVAYSACWDQCTLSGTAQVITRPACSTLPATSSTNTTAPDATITTPPSQTETACHKPGQCIDFLTTCGSSIGLWGACYNPCEKSEAPKPPACTLAPVTVTQWPGNVTTTTTTRSRVSAGPRPACTHTKAWMCAPANW
ncbi:hypothetical protein BDV96DRAFT_602253 [Lophiotrema nucula]|uniref:Uncharacterized protein n=1 Tax=Lophiotrema nucula TaxID=690887 RepID=A0A6A5Z0F8_9PLEO|nr:hypothetical protein BDV96DRAFT_602253 [Lophiotrema nucula]